MTVKTIVHKVECCGRNKNRGEVLEAPVVATVSIRLTNRRSDSISLAVECPHTLSAGGHGERNCNASGDTGVGCPFTIDIPYAVDYYKK